MMKLVRDLIVPGCSALVCAALLWKGYPSRVTSLKTSYDVTAAPPLAQLSPSFVNILTLGNKALYDDFINLWLLQMLVAPERPIESERLLTTIRAVIRHKPKFETLYLLSCFTLYLDYKRPEACQEIILAGLEAFPQSWRLPMTQAYVHYFLLKEPAQAASFFQMAASRPGSPAYVQNLVKKLISENQLDTDDLESSLQILSSQPAGAEFIKVLRSLGKLQSEDPATQNQEKQ